MPYFVYSLEDPRIEEVRYVGITNDVRRRIRAHLSCRDGNEVKNAWMRQLSEATLIPSIKILETVESEEIAREKERIWIQIYLNQGANLLNMKDNEHEKVKSWRSEIIEKYPDLLEYPHLLAKIKQDQRGFNAIKAIFEDKFSDEEIANGHPGVRYE